MDRQTEIPTDRMDAAMHEVDCETRPVKTWAAYHNVTPYTTGAGPGHSEIQWE